MNLVIEYATGSEDENVYGPFETREAATLWAIENLAAGTWDYGILRTVEA